ncbi:hypothetical protein VIGAN_11210200, partial [Vigna angularis var. angularis]
LMLSLFIKQQENTIIMQSKEMSQNQLFYVVFFYVHMYLSIFTQKLLYYSQNIADVELISNKECSKRPQHQNKLI